MSDNVNMYASEMLVEKYLEFFTPIKLLLAIVRDGRNRMITELQVETICVISDCT